MDKTTLTALILLFFLVAFVSGCSSTADEIWTGTDVLTKSYFHSDSQFIISLHGKIIEDEGLNAIHPDYGRYEYNEILVYLASSGGQIISEIRPAGTDPIAYAETAAVWINHLLDHGIPPQKIFVIGFSKGAAITIHLSDFLKNPGINYVLIGICSDEIKANSQIILYGRILSLFEISDPLGGSCLTLADRSPGVSDFREISFSTGEEHGAFYQADSFWLDPLLDWISEAK